MPTDLKDFEKLLFSYFSGEISEDESKCLFEYLKNNYELRTKYDEIAKTRAILFVPLLEQNKNKNYRKLNIKKQLLLRPIITYLVRIAAILLLIIMPVYFTYSILKSPDVEPEVMYYETEASYSSQSKVILPDSSVVWLNSGSRLLYNGGFGKNNRSVSLHGEGYFEVNRNTDIPFLVEAGQMQIKILGTAFNVRNYTGSDKIEVDLLKGKLQVIILDSTQSKHIEMIPNQKTIYNKQEKSLLLTDTNAILATLWREGRVYFMDATFVDISKYLERKYDVKINIQSPDIQKEVFTGTLNMNQPVENVLKYIDADNKFDIVINDKLITITNKSR